MSGATCPAMGAAFNNMSDSKKEEMMRMYETMIKQGHHK